MVDKVGKKSRNPVGGSAILWNIVDTSTIFKEALHETPLWSVLLVFSERPAVSSVAKLGRNFSEQQAISMLTALGCYCTKLHAYADLDLNKMSGVEFEGLVSAMLQNLGFTTRITAVTGDGGIDIEAYLEAPVTGGKYLVQCKRFTDTTVGEPVVRDFYGGLRRDIQATKGIIVTTSDFTGQARAFAAAVGIELINGEGLRFLLRGQDLTNSFSPASTSKKKEPLF